MTAFHGLTIDNIMALYRASLYLCVIAMATPKGPIRMYQKRLIPILSPGVIKGIIKPIAISKAREETKLEANIQNPVIIKPIKLRSFNSINCSFQS
jgi:hypothetical protein